MRSSASDCSSFPPRLVSVAYLGSFASGWSGKD